MYILNTLYMHQKHFSVNLSILNVSITTKALLSLDSNTFIAYCHNSIIRLLKMSRVCIETMPVVVKEYIRIIQDIYANTIESINIYSIVEKKN